MSFYLSVWVVPSCMHTYIHIIYIYIMHTYIWLEVFVSFRGL